MPIHWYRVANSIPSTRRNVNLNTQRQNECRRCLAPWVYADVLPCTLNISIYWVLRVYYVHTCESWLVRFCACLILCLVASHVQRYVATLWQNYRSISIESTWRSTTTPKVIRRDLPKIPHHLLSVQGRQFWVEFAVRWRTTHDSVSLQNGKWGLTTQVAHDNGGYQTFARRSEGRNDAPPKLAKPEVPKQCVPISGPGATSKKARLSAVPKAPMTWKSNLCFP